MDYIQEELLRQRKILSVLMSGGQSKAVEETAPQRDDALFDRETEMDPRVRIHSEWDLEEVPVRLQSRTDEFGRSGANTRRAEPRGGKAWRQRAGVLLLSEETDAPVRMVPYERTVPESSADVREVSRSIQRDARRYDGGFSIY